MRKMSTPQLKLQKATGPLHPIPVNGVVWSQVGMDLIGPLHTTKRGNKFINNTVTIIHILQHRSCVE